jgi:hypothetical protein
MVIAGCEDFDKRLNYGVEPLLQRLMLMLDHIEYTLLVGCDV